ncbi:hypothetical protein K469DRAFT_705591 [Zopfia rhizophila CBS 207.26]|uniref:F-box domain-containing protein n=1 Tax=Zopfia rhizophila CBS 207.26 TaxID=1314779 RepID=A0A6A6E560_9PEZI|nr:hypothetical protein K469DRAFT_705591 [Zopfia rhizophila CBS 207.26]
MESLSEELVDRIVIQLTEIADRSTRAHFKALSSLCPVSRQYRRIAEPCHYSSMRVNIDKNLQAG